MRNTLTSPPEKYFILFRKENTQRLKNKEITIKIQSNLNNTPKRRV